MSATLPRLDPHVLSSLKLAAAQTPDDRQVEQAFAEQVYQQVANKAGVLMEGPHRIGFEVVNKNDSNTKMMGIWAFRLAPDDRDNLVYVPCFFRNGKISVDSLYQVRKKRFRTFTPEWCQQLVDTSTLANGEPIAKSQTAKFRPLIHLERIMNSPTKMASLLKGQTKESQDFFASRDLAADLTEMCTQLEFSGSPLRRLAEQVGGAKVASILLSAAEASEKFAAAMAAHMEEWGPLFEIPAPQVTKQASTDRVLCSFSFGQEGIKYAKSIEDTDQRVKVAAEVQRRGHWFNGVENGESPDYTTIYQGNEMMHEVSHTYGFHRALMRDGETEDVVTGKDLDLWALTNPRYSPLEVREQLDRSNYCTGTATLGLSPRRAENRRVVGLKSRALSNFEGPLVLAHESGAEPPKKDNEALQDLDSMKEGNVYVLWQEDQSLLVGPFKLDQKRTTDDGTAFLTSWSNEPLLYRPDSKEPYGYGTVNNSWKVIKLDIIEPKERHDTSYAAPCSSGGFVYKKPIFPASRESLRDLLDHEIVKKASITHDQGLYTIDFHGRQVLPCNRLNAMIKLAGCLAVHPDMAATLLDQAEQNTTTSFCATLPEKHASAMLRIVDSPEFTYSTDPILQIRTEEPQMRVLRTERTPIYTPAMRIGDHYRMPNQGSNPEEAEGMTLEKAKRIPDDILLRGDPNAIAEYAGTKGIVSVLDHGVLAGMAKVYDVQTYLDEYLTMLEEGLDGLGRVLFMFRWKPEDFQKLYGTDDMKELEDKLLSSFKSLGDVLLDLMRQSNRLENSARTS